MWKLSCINVKFIGGYNLIYVISIDNSWGDLHEWRIVNEYNKEDFEKNDISGKSRFGIIYKIFKTERY